MNSLERLFLVTDFLFPAKTPRLERKKLYRDLASLSPGLHRVALLGREGYLDTPELLPPSVEVSSEPKGADALILDLAPQDAIALVDRETMPPLLVVPVAFQERYAGRPFYAALLRLLEARGYSLFNLYNVVWKRGQIRTAYALYINRKLRDDFVRKIQV